MMASQKGIRKGFNRALDQLSPFEQAIMNSPEYRELGFTSAAAMIASEIAEKSRKSHPDLIPKYRVGQRVIFKIGIDAAWQPAKRHYGRILKVFQSVRWHYLIEDDNGSRYSLAWSKVIMNVDLTIPEPSNIIQFKAEMLPMVAEKDAAA